MIIRREGRRGSGGEVTQAVKMECSGLRRKGEWQFSERAGRESIRVLLVGDDEATEEENRCENRNSKPKKKGEVRTHGTGDETRRRCSE